MQYAIMFFLVMIYLPLNAQTGIDSTVKNYLLNLEIAEMKMKSPISNGSMGFLPMYQGDIPGAIAILHSLPTGRVMATGNVPDIHIRFRAFRPYTFITSDSILAKRLQCDLTQQPYEDKDVLAQVIFSVLETKYNFTVSDTTDLVDVWILRVVDSVELSKHISFDNDGYCGLVDMKTRKLTTTNFSLHDCLCMQVEQHSRQIIYDETNDDRKFNIILDDYLEGLSDFDIVNTNIIRYGLQFFKEKRLEKLKHVHFR